MQTVWKEGQNPTITLTEDITDYGYEIERMYFSKRAKQGTPAKGQC